MNLREPSFISLNKKNDYMEEEDEDDNLLHKYNLFQQFFIIGINHKILHLLNKRNYKEIPEEILGPKILSKYPNGDLPYITISDSIIPSHCFPNGFLNSIIECVDNELEDKIHQTYDFVFSLDNYQFNKNSSLRINKIYYICYLFYEKLNDYQNCYDLIKTKNKIINKNKVERINVLIPKVICLTCFSPFFQQGKSLLHYLKKYIERFSYNNLMRIISLGASNLDDCECNFPIEKIIEGIIYNLPGLPRSNYVVKISSDNFILDNNETKLKELIFENSPPNKTPKPIINYSLLMKFFKIEEIFQIIKYILLEEPILFFSDNIQYLTYTIEGLLSLIYPFEYQYPVVAVLPEENYSFINIYNSFIFGINQNYYDEFFNSKGINIEEQNRINIVIIESRFTKLLNSKEMGENTKNPILHLKSNKSRLLKIDQNSVNDSIKEMKQFYLNQKLCSNSDKNKIIKNKNEEKNIIDNNETNIILPMHYYLKCCKKIENNMETKYKGIKAKLKEKEKNVNVYKKLAQIEKENLFSNEITENFLYFFISILLHYQEYCTKYHLSYIIKKNENINEQKENRYCRNIELEKKYYNNELKIEDFFNYDKFIENIPSLDKPFYLQFFKTKIFFNFMLKKFFPQSIQDKLDILFFDDKINEKLSREAGAKKVETKFLEYDSSNISGEINIGNFQNFMDTDYKKFLSQDKNQAKALNYFQHITSKTMVTAPDNNEKKSLSPSIGESFNKTFLEYEPNSTITSYVKINFHYFVFPRLLNDDLFYKEKKKEGDNSFLFQRINTNFTSKNSNSLYNQFIKEGSSIVNNEDFIKNYLNYHFSLNPSMTYSRPYEDYIKNLWLAYFAKTFYQIPYSQKKFVFEYLIVFMNKNKNILEENIIMNTFDAILKYGDKKMIFQFLPFIKNKTYSMFLKLREKINKNFKQIEAKDFKKHKRSLNFENNENKNERTVSGCNFIDLRFNNWDTLRLKDINISYKSGIIKKSNNDTLFEDTFSNEFINKNVNYNERKLEFILNLYCTQKKGDQYCLKPCELQTNFIFDEYNTYMNFKCLKCGKNQDLTITCKYHFKDAKNSPKNEKNYTINSKLYSPLTLLREEWLTNSSESNLSLITENHLESYICAMFYFYEMGLLCDFLIPEILKEKNLTEETITNNDSTEKKKDKTHQKDSKDFPESLYVDIIEENDDGNKKDFNLNKEVEITTAQNNNFFELKSSLKSSIRKKVLTKKSVEFVLNDGKKKSNHKKNIFSFSGFINEKV